MRRVSMVTRCVVGFGYTVMHDPSNPREQLAALHARSAHSEANRSYLTARLDGLAEAISGPDGLMARLARVEEKLDHLEKRERRHVAWLAALVPLIAVGVQYLLSLI